MHNHCDITMDNNFVMDIHCDIKMGNDVWASIVILQWEMMLLWTSMLLSQYDAMDNHCDITMCNEVVVCLHSMMSQYIVMLLGSSFIVNYYTQL